MKPLPTQATVPALRRAMRNTEQTQGMSVLQHGLSVARHFNDLYQHCVNHKPLKYQWQLPDWVNHPVLWDNLMSLDVMHEYLIYHDVGKPFCRTIDEQGRVHFPDHAAVSKKIWLNATGNQAVADLIGMDMDVHLLKGADTSAFAERPQATSLLLAGLCEVHSNAAMFGGIDSTSFKIKFKHIKRRGNAIVKHLQTKEKS